MLYPLAPGHHILLVCLLLSGIAAKFVFPLAGSSDPSGWLIGTCIGGAGAGSVCGARSLGGGAPCASRPSDVGPDETAP